MRRMVVVLVAACVAVSVMVPAAAQDVPVVPWSDALPPVVPDEPAPDHVDQCGEDGLACLAWVEEQLAGWEAHFGCDHRAVFSTVYRLLTRELRLTVVEDPAFFDDPAGLGFEAVAFYELYAQMLTDHAAGRPVPDAWQVAMDVAERGDWTGGHDMLLSISAHVQRDMPFAMARVGLALPDGSSRKPDHDRGNRVLAAAYQPIVQAVAERYDPLMSDVEAVPVADDVGAQQLVAGWREGVWRNAESLVATEGSPARSASVAAIDTNARAWAELMRTGEVPGHRTVRDAHCEAYLNAQEDDGAEAPVTAPPAATPDAAPAPADPSPTPPVAAAPPVVAADAGGDLPTTGGGVGALALGALVAGVVGARRRP